MAKSKWLHTVTGLVDEIEDDLASAFPTVLKKVEDDAKSFVAGMFKSGTVEEFDAAHPDGIETTDNPSESEAPAATAITDPPADPVTVVAAQVAASETGTETPAPTGDEGAPASGSDAPSGEPSDTTPEGN